jgi:phosphatidylglycerol:prolipoprotein diacylglycerol transferase
MDGLTLADCFQFNVWSFAVPAAIVSGYWLAYRRARQAGLDTREFESATQWAIGLGLVVSHMVEILLYQRDRLKTEGWLTLFKFWEGLSSYGGFFGAIVTLFVFYGLKKKRWWREADALIQGLFLGWIFGRFGCTVSGDHPGPRTKFFLAYPYASGPRHNLGLYEMLFTMFVIVPANFILFRKRPPVGSFLALDCLLYGAGRFALDFLRATDLPDSDPRYLGLTLAHYCSLAVFVFGLVMLVLARGRKLEPPSPASSSPAV